jgi:hypothetical protein
MILGYSASTTNGTGLIYYATTSPSSSLFSSSSTTMNLTGLAGSTTYTISLYSQITGGLISSSVSISGSTLSSSVFNPTNCMICYSMRLAISSYTGPVVQLKRSSDNSISDFYTNATQSYLTTGANGTGTSFTSWVGAGVAYVQKWYDQSGKGNHGTIAGTTWPQISTRNGSYVVFFNRSNTTYLNITNPIQPKTVFCSVYRLENVYDTIITTQYDYGVRFGSNGRDLTNGNANDWYFSGQGTKIAYNKGVSSSTVYFNAWNIISLSVSTPIWITIGTNNNNSSFNRVGTNGYDANRGIYGYMLEIICHNTTMTGDDMVDYYNNVKAFNPALQ